MIKIAFLGDSLVDTLFFGDKFWDLELLLQQDFPKKKFELLNYGVGSTDAELGLYRLTNDYEYKERGRFLSSLSGLRPEIIIIGDFTYNHWTDSQADLQKYSSTIQKIISASKEIADKVWLYQSMTPNKKLYVTGIPWLGWDEIKRVKEYKTTRLYQSEFSKIVESSKLPTLNCLDKTLINGDGDPKYISNVDYIHPSAAMRQLVADLVVNQLTVKLSTLT
ncbi:SGNH/GDSL hydrolase family protein [Candidatus Woesebacteria bacterium]|nr:SGNH/GDSL hydrolase family protein [Candidatus Woesebacteria bacterium]